MKNIMVVDKDTLSRECIISYIAQIDSETSVYEYNSFPDVNGPVVTYATVDFIIIKLLETADKNFKALNALNNRCWKAKLIILTQLENIPGIKRRISNSSICTIAVDIPRLRIFNSIKYFLNEKPGAVNFTQASMKSSAADCDSSISSYLKKPTTNYRDRLTDRQSQVINCIVKGYSNKQIAYELGICEGTIKLHVSSILRILKVSNRTQAAQKYCKSEYVQVTNEITRHNSHNYDTPFAEFSGCQASDNNL